MTPLHILAEQLTTAYELAKDEGLQGDELNAVVVRHLEGVRRAVPVLEPITVTLRAPGFPDLDVTGWMLRDCPGLAVTPTRTGSETTSDTRYRVTHTPSGLRFGEHPLDETDALALMSDLYATGVDWTKDADALTPADRALARPVLRRYMGVVRRSDARPAPEKED